MVNAYKNEVYSQLFSVDGDEASRDLPVALNEPLVSSFEAALDRVPDLKDAAGAVAIEAEQLQRRAYVFANGKWTIDRSEQLVAENIARIALIRYERSELESAGTLKACYVRPSEAEIKLSLGLLGSKIKRNMKR
jgi:tRNA A37 threonylcarbamoyladenosine modification protein TsaB